MMKSEITLMLTQDFTYFDNEIKCNGFISLPHNCINPKPCVMIAHDWGGCNQFAINKTKEISKLGYIGFALDIYGDRQTSEDKHVKRKLMTPFLEDRKMLVNRLKAGFKAIQQFKMVNPYKIAAIGYCFGGLGVLDLARAGADLQGVVSFHGMLYPPRYHVATKILSKILILHGYDDPLCLPDQIDTFANEMTAKNVDWQLHAYGKVKHSFTNPKANDLTMGLEYNLIADRRSWQSCLNFIEECFG